ncbi:MAG: heterodisulfide reductase-related iron-sulfur binding cluster [Candidatus Freyarchaeota archaeon]
MRGLRLKRLQALKQKPLFQHLPQLQDPRVSKPLLQLEFTIIDEWCCGSPLWRTGRPEIAEELMKHNIKEKTTLLMALGYIYEEIDSSLAFRDYCCGAGPFAVLACLT